MKHNTYMARRRAKFSSIFEGPVNLPWGTEVQCREVDGERYLFHGDKLLCAAGSQITKDFFVQNDDGRGADRGKLIKAIEKQLTRKNEQDETPKARWAKIWDDPRCKPYKRPEDENYWRWNEDFYNAPIGDLEHIAGLVGAKI